MRYYLTALSCSILALLSVTVLILALVGFHGCASLQADKNDPIAMNAAQCKDAQLGLAIAQVMVPTAQTPDSQTYWDRYFQGAQLAILTYCMKP